jgi:hypothetical protein
MNLILYFDAMVEYKNILKICRTSALYTHFKSTGLARSDLNIAFFLPYLSEYEILF